jgi:hypothetical protein
MRERQVATFQKKYGEGVIRPMDVPGADEQRKATIKEKYGAENVFCRESSIFDKVQASLDGKRPVLVGADNPFAWPEVQEKIRQTNLAKYGVENPQQNVDVRAKTQTTSLERYGVEECLSSPAIREKIVATNEERYGGPAPACSPDVVEKARQTNLERWGVEWTSQHPGVRQKQYRTMLDTYGSHYFASEEGRAAIRAALMERYGVDHPAKINGFWEKTVATFVRRYGATHPLLLTEFLEKRAQTCMQRFGAPSPTESPEIYARLVETVQAKYGVKSNVFQAESVKEKSRQTNVEKYGSSYFLASEENKRRNIEKYGFPHPMMNREYARAQLEKIRRPGPNLPERLLHKLAPELLYTGDGSFWRWLPALGHHKNPDFILPGPDPQHPKKEVTAVVELFGDFWHSRMFTGKANFDHESELVQAFAEIGLRCLVVWESEVKKHSEAVQAKIQAFLHG